MNDLRLVWMSPAELAENPSNWRRHPQNQIDALTDVMAEVGWAGACLYNERTNRLIDGHARRKVALEQGTDKVPVLVGSWSEEDEKKILLTLDPLASMAQADAAALDALLADVSTSSTAVQEMLDGLKEQYEAVNGYNNPVAGSQEEEEAGDELEDGLDLLFKAPYPYFGGKARIAAAVWKRFGEIHSYIEPFFGSGAVFLNRPQPFDGNETVNDFDGLIANFWRAVQAQPDEVAKWCDWPVNENDLTARHAWLVARKDTLQAKLEGDPNYFDAKIAGWWCWGMALWIGGRFCAGNGPWQVVEAEDGSRQLVHLGDEGQGVQRKLVHLGNEGQGVQRKRVHLGDEGRGVQRQLVHLGDEGRAGLGEQGLYAWMQALSDRLRRVRVCCGDWRRVCGGNDGDAIRHFFGSGEPCGVFLDPPYSAEAGRDMGCYRIESGTVAHDVREWCLAHSDDPRLRIALCGYEGEGHDMLVEKGWRMLKWKTVGGMALVGDNQRGKDNCRRERVWFSPSCETNIRK